MHTWCRCLSPSAILSTLYSTQGMPSMSWRTNSLIIVSTRAGFEPTISRLKVECSNHEITKPTYSVLGTDSTNLFLCFIQSNSFDFNGTCYFVHLLNFPPFFTRETAFVASCLLSCTPSFRGEAKTVRVASPENKSIPITVFDLITAHTPISAQSSIKWSLYDSHAFYLLLYKSICCWYSFELPRQVVEAIQMSTNNICFYRSNSYKCQPQML